MHAFVFFTTIICPLPHKALLPQGTAALPNRSSTPGFSSLGFHLVDPRLVDVHWIRFDIEGLVLHDLLDHWGQDLPQGILPTGTTVEAHHHLYDCGVSGHDLV